MRNSLFHVERQEAVTLQAQIREQLVSAILTGQLATGAPVPSTRAMAARLGVSRNTVMIAYQDLEADGYLEARERSGFFVADGIPGPSDGAEVQRAKRSGTDFSHHLRHHPSAERNIKKPRDWPEYPYPFLYGQIDAGLFPITAWRDCTRQAMSRKWLDAWTHDRFTEDDPMLIEQIRQRVLTRRGILADTDEILVTMGAQNALYLIAQLLVGPDTIAAVEDPGFPDIRNILGLSTPQLRPVPVDNEGIRADALTGARIAYVTPSHQSPTNVTMSLARRQAVLDWADAEDALIIEDDYEFETNLGKAPFPALKSLDRAGRVIYVGSLSKSLMPGLRLGFMVGPPEIIAEARALRRMILRHPPGNNQRVVALFLSLGHHDALIGRVQRSYSDRLSALYAALERHIPDWTWQAPSGGSSVWVEGPAGTDMRRIATAAAARGVLIEPGDICFANPKDGHRFARLGISSIALDRIEPGIAELAAAKHDAMPSAKRP